MLVLLWFRRLFVIIRFRTRIIGIVLHKKLILLLLLFMWCCLRTDSRASAMAEKPLSHSAVDAGMVKIKSTRPKRFGNWSAWDLFRAFHAVVLSLSSQSTFEYMSDFTPSHSDGSRSLSIPCLSKTTLKWSDRVCIWAVPKSVNNIIQYENIAHIVNYK